MKYWEIPMQQHSALLAISLLAIMGCGVPNDQHNGTVEELRTTKEKLATATRRVQELQAEVERLSKTDSGQWSRIQDLRSKRLWLSVIEEIDRFLESWPRSPYVEQARKLRADASESQAADLLAEARSQIGQQRFSEAEAVLRRIKKDFPTSHARVEAEQSLPKLEAEIAAAKRREIGNGDWSSSTETSPVDDSTNVNLLLASESTIKGKFGKEAQPTLFVRCKEGKTDIFVDWGVYLGIGETNVLHRLDDRSARTLEWSISTDYEATFYPGSDVGFARELLSHEKLLLRVTPYGESPVSATFHLKGLENAIVPLMKACRWK